MRLPSADLRFNKSLPQAYQTLLIRVSQEWAAYRHHDLSAKPIAVPAATSNQGGLKIQAPREG
jgi:hypothetical protein